MLPLVEKYRAKSLSEIKGQDLAISEIKAFFSTFPRKKAVILNGPVGTGKTSLAIALATENNLELFELNASDLRNRSKLEEVLRPSIEQQSLFKKGKIILMDEADGITGNNDRGGIPELIALSAKTPYPIIITANDIWQKKFSLLRQKCQIVNLKPVSEMLVGRILTNISLKESKKVSDQIIKLIIRKARGDVRAALNDLQSVFDLGERQFIEEISEREKQEGIFEALKKLFQSSTDAKTVNLFDNTHMELDEILLWIEENIPLEYKGRALAKAYNYLSKADIFRGRIYRQQYWRFLVYQNFFISFGVSSATKLKNKGFVKYQRPSRILKIWLANQKNAKKKSILVKYARFCHMSKKKASRDVFLMPFIMDSLDERTKEKMDLNESEINYLKERKEIILQQVR